MGTPEYLDAFKRAKGITSDYALAKAWSMRPSNISSLRNGRSSLSTLHCFEVAHAIGADPSTVHADIELERAERSGNQADVSAWRRVIDRLATTTAAVVLGAGLIGPSPAQSSTLARTYGDSAGAPLYIMSTRRRAWRAVVDALAGFVSGPRLRLA